MTIYSQQYDLHPQLSHDTITQGVNLRQTRLVMPQNIGYIAGTADGIVTVRGKPAAREILLMDANSADYQFLGRIWSDDNGRYMFTDLDPDKQYLIMARDYNKEFEPFAYDYVTPATDIAPDEQQALRESWAE